MDTRCSVHPPKLLPAGVAGVFLRRAGGAASVFDVLGEQGFEFLHDVGVLIYRILPLADQPDLIEEGFRIINFTDEEIAF